MATLEKFRDLRTQAIHENLERRGIKNGGDRQMVSIFMSSSRLYNFYVLKTDCDIFETIKESYC